MTPNEALHEILRAFEAWDSDEPFEAVTDAERRFTADMDFVAYMGDVAGAAVLPALSRLGERP